VESREENIFSYTNILRVSDFQEIFINYKKKNYKKKNYTKIEFKIKDFLDYKDISFLFNSNICKTDLLFFIDKNIEKSFNELSS